MSKLEDANQDQHVTPVDVLLRNSLESTHALFLANYAASSAAVAQPDDAERFLHIYGALTSLILTLHNLPLLLLSQRAKLASKMLDEWAHVKVLAPAIAAQLAKAKETAAVAKQQLLTAPDSAKSSVNAIIDKLVQDSTPTTTLSSAVAIRSKLGLPPTESGHQESATALVRIKESRKMPKPEWHAPWKLMRVISGHLGWVRSIAVDCGNEWFATGAGDRVVKIWDLATGTLKLSLTGHISTVRGLAVSSRHPYLFTCGEDKMVKCWDLEYNKVIRHYHGHLSGVYCMSLHPTLDVLVTGGRDATGRVWDIRTKNQIFALTGHQGTIADVKTQESDPQIITASSDSTVKLWDLAAGKATTTLTNHKKSVRALAINPNENTFASASTDNIKQWKFPRGDFIQNLSGHNSIVNTLSINQDNVMFSGGDNGSMYFWDYKTGYNFQTAEAAAQPGSLDSENGIFCSTFDQTGTRLITGEGDKTIKVWKEDERATPETHPVNFKPEIVRPKY
ncbi:pre-mRNA-splicing factor prp46 [Physocladia obscura]|uniref:Pre-mRNA-splicing factor prp46 n=1 Tax=Physocladia obscura TaxID=109957 RepID=A0AAD5XBK0_9FUNG|nr:pre-mRNA-splicing factor prp46 [Physocladia obscura]